jgi:hypothetical protein
VSRCVVCGRLPAEPCHAGVHKAHKRMWETLAGTLGTPAGNQYSAYALEVLEQINGNEINPEAVNQ